MMRTLLLSHNVAVGDRGRVRRCFPAMASDVDRHLVRQLPV